MAAHLYWRINVAQNNNSSNTSIAEIQMRTTAGSADQCTGGTATDSGNIGTGYEGAKVFDDNAATMWNKGGVGWVRYQFASAVDIVEYTVASRNDNSAYLADSPFVWTFEYSDDGSAWTVADSVRSQYAWGLGEVRTFTVGANTGNPGGQSVGVGMTSIRPAVEVTPPSGNVIALGKAPATNARTVSGTVTVGGVATGGLLVRAYAKATGELIGQATSAGDGSYSINCGNSWADVYVVAFNPTTYQMLAFDQVGPA
ncbi:conserved hypothetical protein [Cupriavidus taiwanensis]|uniref:hypothetical protein n=1 Tax=Cupriavidus taiwanensis TaxID=164546 RepID=UPI000E138F2A|nr:hypothetical protein [Cupriavidus taiwanensis]SOZ99439.1 conserved hypothetical protein [Cupriavidus taiwanensis]